MEHEARRYGGNNQAILTGWELPEVWVPEEQRSRVAERILARSIDRTVDQELEMLARRTPGLAAAIDWIEARGHGLSRSRQYSARNPIETGALAGGVRRDDRFDADVGFKLDAHPRAVFKTRFGILRSRIDLPLLNEPVRLTVECPLGSHSGVALSAGGLRGEDEWARLTLRLGF